MGHDPLLNRVRRVVGANIDTAVGAIEGVSHHALLREAVRELESAEAALRRDRDRVAERRDSAEADQKARRAKAAEMAENAFYALSKGRDDLATQAVAYQLDLEVEADRLVGFQAEAKIELRQLDEALVELTARGDPMRKDVAAAQKVSSSGAAKRSTRSPQSTIDSAVDRANQIFERANGSKADKIIDPSTARGLLKSRL